MAPPPPKARPSYVYRYSRIEYSADGWIEHALSGGADPTKGVAVRCAEHHATLSFTARFTLARARAFYNDATSVPRVTCAVDGETIAVDPPSQQPFPSQWLAWDVCDTRSVANGSLSLPLRNHTLTITVVEAALKHQFCFEHIETWLGEEDGPGSIWIPLGITSAIVLSYLLFPLCARVLDRPPRGYRRARSMVDDEGGCAVGRDAEEDWQRTALPSDVPGRMSSSSPELERRSVSLREYPCSDWWEAPPPSQAASAVSLGLVSIAHIIRPPTRDSNSESIAAASCGSTPKLSDIELLDLSSIDPSGEGRQH